MSLRRQHADGVVRQLVTAIGGLAAPDREDHAGRHAEALLDFGQRRAMLRRELLAAVGKPGERQLADVVRGRLDELRLPGWRPALPARQIEIGQRHVRLKPVDRR
jgi:hypothetical protein